MILTVIPFDKYNLFRDCDFVNSLENKKYIDRKKIALSMILICFIFTLTFNAVHRRF